MTDKPHIHKEDLYDGPFWTISPEFIISLGETYISILTRKILDER